MTGVPWTRLGRVTETPQLVVRGVGGRPDIDAPLADLKAAWQRPLAWD